MSIIQYQNVSKTSHIHRLWLPFDAFMKQLLFFKEHHSVITIDAALDFMEKKISVNGKRPICLTFDNGYLDFYDQVWPALSDYGFPSIVLISPPKIGKRVTIGDKQVSYLTWQNIRELIDNDVKVGAYEDHTWNINKVPEELLIRHITEYKRSLEDGLGVKIEYFGIKEGVPNDKIRDLLISEGYRALLTQCPTFRRPDLYSLGRIQVDDDDFNIFLTKISKTYLFFKDKRSWKYIRKYGLDKIAHRISESFDRIRGIK